MGSEGQVPSHICGVLIRGDTGAEDEACSVMKHLPSTVNRQTDRQTLMPSLRIHAYTVSTWLAEGIARRSEKFNSLTQLAFTESRI